MRMKYSRSILAFMLSVCVAAPCFGQPKQLNVSKKDKSAIVDSILNQFFLDYPDEIDSGEVVLSSLNIDPTYVPKSAHVKLLLMSPNDIASKVRRSGFLDYLVFSKLEMKGSKVFATLENISVRKVESGIEPFFGHGFFWEGKKKSGKWVFECVNTTAFTSINGISGNYQIR